MSQGSFYGCLAKRRWGIAKTLAGYSYDLQVRVPLPACIRLGSPACRASLSPAAVSHEVA